MVKDRGHGYDIFLKDFCISKFDIRDIYVHMSKDDVTFINENLVNIVFNDKTYKATYVVEKGVYADIEVDTEKIINNIKDYITKKCVVLYVNRKVIHDTKLNDNRVNVLLDLPKRLWNTASSHNCRITINANQCAVYDEYNTVLIVFCSRQNKNMKVKFNYQDAKTGKWIAEYEDAHEFVDEVMKSKLKKKYIQQ